MNHLPNWLLAEKISAAYDTRQVLHDVSFSIGKGTILGIIGPNGAGKTTLLRILSRALPPLNGSLYINGKNLGTIRRTDLSKWLAFVPQSLNMPMAFTVLEFVALGRTPHVSGWSRLSSRDRAAIDKSLTATDLLGFENRLLDELSAGERHRALVAMALAQTPEILLLDEPTAHLDIHHAWKLMEIIRRQNQEEGTTVILSTHDLNLAAEFCTQLLLLEKGHKVAFGPPLEVLKPEELSRVYEYPLKVLRMDEDLCVRPVSRKD
jgi:iron complex transport system ATP-binding protein